MEYIAASFIEGWDAKVLGGYGPGWGVVDICAAGGASAGVGVGVKVEVEVEVEVEGGIITIRRGTGGWVWCSCGCGCDCEFLRKRLDGVHSGVLATRSGGGS